MQAYQLLRHGGVPEDNIVVMMADDIAEHETNPRPHQVFNHPEGPDVYDGVRIVRVFYLTSALLLERVGMLKSVCIGSGSAAAMQPSAIS